MTDGINLDGFTANRHPAGTNDINAHYSDNPGSAFAASDMSTQGNAGLNKEGSSDTGTDAPGVSEGMYS
jgi:hypothetical protein